jgi:hypothetical protein
LRFDRRAINDYPLFCGANDDFPASAKSMTFSKRQLALLIMEGYGYQLSKRQAMYPFMVEHLGLDPNGVIGADGTFDENKNAIETPDQMRVFDDQYPLPQHTLEPGSSVQF